MQHLSMQFLYAGSGHAPVGDLTHRAVQTSMMHVVLQAPPNVTGAGEEIGAAVMSIEMASMVSANRVSRGEQVRAVCHSERVRAVCLG